MCKPCRCLHIRTCTRVPQGHVRRHASPHSVVAEAYAAPWTVTYTKGSARSTRDTGVAEGVVGEVKDAQGGGGHERQARCQAEVRDAVLGQCQPLQEARAMVDDGQERLGALVRYFAAVCAHFSQRACACCQEASDMRGAAIAAGVEGHIERRDARVRLEREREGEQPGVRQVVGRDEQDPQGRVAH